MAMRGLEALDIRRLSSLARRMTRTREYHAVPRPWPCCQAQREGADRLLYSEPWSRPKGLSSASGLRPREDSANGGILVQLMMPQAALATYNPLTAGAPRMTVEAGWTHVQGATLRIVASGDPPAAP